MRKKDIKRITAITSSVVMAACTMMGTYSTVFAEDASEVSEPVYGGTLNVAVGSVTYLDPQIESADEPMGRHIFETVLSLDGDYNVHPGVCNYEVSDDNLTITLTVRDGVTFHDGTPVTADDVAASLERWTQNVSNGQLYLGQYLDSIEVVDDACVIHLNQVASSVLAGLGYEYMGAFVLPASVCEKYPDSAITDDADLIGTGPYRFVEWVRDSHVTVERYEDYVPTENDCDGPAGTKNAYVDQIVFNFATDEDAEANGVLAGTYDLAENVNYSMYLSQQENPDVNFYLIEDGTHVTTVMDKSEGWTANETFRQAVQACMDCEAVMTACFGTEELYSLDGSWYYDISSDLYNQADTERAQELLEESGYDGSELIYLTQESGYYYTSAYMAVEQMKAIGINVTLKVVDQAELYSLRNDPENFDFFACAITMKADPTMLAFISDTWPGLWVSDAKSELLTQLAAATELEDKQALWQEMTDVIYTEVPLINYGSKINCTMTTARTQNATYEGSEPYYWNIWLSE